jgi:hypothetical protein
MSGEIISFSDIRRKRYGTAYETSATDLGEAFSPELEDLAAERNSTASYAEEFVSERVRLAAEAIVAFDGLVVEQDERPKPKSPEMRRKMMVLDTRLNVALGNLSIEEQDQAYALANEMDMDRLGYPDAS